VLFILLGLLQLKKQVDIQVILGVADSVMHRLTKIADLQKEWVWQAIYYILPSNSFLADEIFTVAFLKSSQQLAQHL